VPLTGLFLERKAGAGEKMGSQAEKDGSKALRLSQKNSGFPWAKKIKSSHGTE